MAARVKFPIVDRRIVFEGGGVFSHETRAAAFAHMARSSIEEIDATNDAAVGRDVAYRTFVDGHETRNLNATKESSVIVARWELGVGVIDYIADLLSKAGPVLTGAYRKSMRIVADGVPIADAQKALGAREVMFVSTVPYARKIERGAKGFAPGHVYEAVAAMANARFSNIARIKFTYVSMHEIPGLQAYARKRLEGVTFTAGRKFRSRPQLTAAQRRKNEHDRLVRQPAIIVYLT